MAAFSIVEVSVSLSMGIGDKVAGGICLPRNSCLPLAFGMEQLHERIERHFAGCGDFRGQVSGRFFQIAEDLFHDLDASLDNV